MDDEKQKQLVADVEALKELVAEVAHKYNSYISVFCFPKSVLGAVDNQPKVDKSE